MTTELIERQTLVTLAECYGKAATLAADGLNKLIEAQGIMKKSLGSRYDDLFPNGKLCCYSLGKNDLDSSQTKIQENFWSYAMDQTGIRGLMSPRTGTV